MATAVSAMNQQLFKVFMAPAASEAVAKVLASGYIGQGPQVDGLEGELRPLLGDVVATNSATSAIDLALEMIGVGPGDEVITTPVTCVATNAPIVKRGARPVWADVEPTSGLLDASDVARKVTRRTKAIMAVDWGGAPCDWDDLHSFGLPVIEDAAHAIMTPGGGDYRIYSFQAIKHLTCGDGGALYCPDPERARLLRWYGLDRRSNDSFRSGQNIAELGFKYHMNDIAAAIGRANLKHLKQIVLAHVRNAGIYQAALSGLRGVEPTPWSLLSSYWIYTVRVRERHKFIADLREQGIECAQVHRRNDSHKSLCYPNGPLPGVDAFDSQQVSIPVGWWLEPEVVEQIAERIRDWDHRNR